MNAIFPYLWQSRMDVLGALARDYLAGEDIKGIVSDFAEECGVLEENMLELEIGRTYLFKTFGLFYEGRVIKATSTVILIDQAKLVVDVGETNAIFTRRAKYTHAEDYPAGTQIRLNPLHVYAAEELPR